MPNDSDKIKLTDGTVVGSGNRRVAVPSASAPDSDGYISFELPSRTMTISIREMESDEENLWGKNLKSDPLGPFYTIFARCVKGLPLLYPAQNKPDINANKIFLDDFTAILFMLRRFSYGDMYKFGIKCPKCDDQYMWQEDLSTTEWFYASDEVSENLKSLNEFEYKTPRGRKIKYRLPVAYDQDRLYRLQSTDKDHLRTEMVRLCILDIDGEGVAHDTTLKKMKASELRFFEQEALNDKGFGVNRTIHPSCIHCDHKIEMELPIDSADFFIKPSMVLKPDGTFTTLLGAT
jgi:hypothetical protein